ncbi:MAG: hypothetical protein QOK39_2508 [Acidimicrobiaceae bacterium]|jgi:hypothetical protein|nr:hypothetical protein [Acidimicrobiaceae bacterium]
MRSRQARAVAAGHFATNDRVTAYPYPLTVPADKLPHGEQPYRLVVIGTGREHPGRGPGILCADRRNADTLLVHPRDLFHPDDICAACAADHAALIREDADMAVEGDATDLPEMMFFARTEDGVLWHIDDWLAYYDADLEEAE